MPQKKVNLTSHLKSGLLCPLCRQADFDTKVIVYYNNQPDSEHDSVIQAENHAIAKSTIPCFIRNQYTCPRCSHAIIKRESYFNPRV